MENNKTLSIIYSDEGYFFREDKDSYKIIYITEEVVSYDKDEVENIIKTGGKVVVFFKNNVGIKKISPKIKINIYSNNKMREYIAVISSIYKDKKHDHSIMDIKAKSKGEVLEQIYNIWNHKYDDKIINIVIEEKSI